MRLLEVVQAERTGPDVLATALALGRRLGKLPVLARNADGFIGNRIFAAYRRHAEYLLEDGAAPQEIDAAVVAYGFAMGPFAVSDMSGLDIAWAMRKRRAATRDRAERYVAIPDLLCESGRLGRKVGKGWYDYPQAGRRPSPVVAELIEAERARRKILPRRFTAPMIQRRLLAVMANEGARVLEQGISLRPSDIDLVFLNGYGFPQAEGGPMYAADQMGLPAVLAEVEEAALAGGAGAFLRGMAEGECRRIGRRSKASAGAAAPEGKGKRGSHPSMVRRWHMIETAAQAGEASRVIRTETCSLASVRRVAAMLDLDPDLWREGDLLPRGWQFILLGADTRRSALRGDGFPGLGVPLPDLGLPRLLLGGRTVEFHQDIPIGACLRRESHVQKLSHKRNADGPMAVVTLAHALFLQGGAEPVLTETQTYLLLGQQKAAGKAPAAAPASPPARTKRIVPDETLLFQYSALGFNSHRIHLDRKFASETEGFPDLVMNGGLATLLLTEFLRTEAGLSPATLRARHIAPLFSGRAMLLGAEETEGRWLLRAFNDEERLAVEIEVEAG